MTRVILYRADNNKYDVLPDDELDSEEVDALHLHDPYTGAQPIY